MESVHIETRVVSYLVARLFACVISQEVIAEALEGGAEMAANRMEALRDLPEKLCSR